MQARRRCRRWGKESGGAGERSGRRGSGGRGAGGGGGRGGRPAARRGAGGRGSGGSGGSSSAAGPPGRPPTGVSNRLSSVSPGRSAREVSKGSGGRSRSFPKRLVTLVWQATQSLGSSLAGGAPVQGRDRGCPP